MSGAGPSLHPGDWPARAIFQFPPDPAPSPIPPPWHGEATFANPFPIPEDIYQGALSYKVPLTIASVYFVTVTFVNWYNRQHGNKPWRIAKTRPFFAFVIFHNVFLAVYSAITCVAMIRALKHSFPHYTEPHAVVGTIDALCKIHGPRGLGDAVTYHADNNTWSSLNPNVLVGNGGLPDTTDVGRLWNEGLAFWGWWFYLSKFYEVLDTAIILAKGKRSTTLQKYHHAGAMLSMWAGMRFMAPPIWMFALVNSGIHAMMYTYYTVSALGLRVPNVVKRTLTTLQITQFLVGSAFAAVHLFVSYTVPVSVAYKITEKVAPQTTSTVAATVSSTVTSATEAIATALPTVTGVAVAFLRKLIYRAAGDEGLAENILLPGSPIPAHQSQRVADAAPSEPAHLNPVQKFFHQNVERTVYRTEYQSVPCVDTSGQAFAIYLNLIYLAPLTILFMRFFFKSYLRRSTPNKQGQPKRRTISDAAGDAKRSVEREFDAIDKSAEDGISTAVNRARDAVRGRKGNVNGQIKDERHGSLSPANKKFIDNVKNRASQQLKELDESAETTTKKAKQFANDLAGKAQDVKGKVTDSWQDVKKEAGQAAENGSQKAKQEAQKGSEKAKQEADKAQEHAAQQGNTDSPSKKSPKKLRKAENKAKREAEASQNLDDAAVAKPEAEAEPKDLKNTLGKDEGKNLV
ncbi:GNS1/SUR4 family protein-like protein [Plenodomus tracheiphilus IPT5]|uniref:Elongation of fatty acids protein n=1 Tax=Plenodomus tracheiphilus IPT5 TaxID=1408161 RepID=A0A6A7B141_9PLEO|nr:GNS1/SUR4 family protein-like protein [Plenodomus tracheiphilus IPT5]